MIFELLADSTLTLVAYKGAGYGLSLTRAALKAKAARGWAATRQRILALELELKQELDSDSVEWLLTQKIQSAEPSYQDKLIRQGNGACQVYCTICKKKYTPHTEHRDYWFFGGNLDRAKKATMQKFCNTHLPAVKAALEVKGEWNTHELLEQKRH